MGEIYCIKNTVNGKCYVGQTINTFAYRYSNKWWKHTSNQILKNSAKKHGVEAFEVVILAKSDRLEELNNLEEYWAATLNAYHPEGYNLSKCGGNRQLHPETIQKLSKPLICSDGQIYRSVVCAAKALQIPVGHISECANGMRRQAKNLAFSYDLSTVPKTKPKKNNNDSYPIICSNGKTYETAAQACAELNVDASSVGKCINGTRKSVKGYTFARFVTDQSAVPTVTSKKRSNKQVFRCDGVVFESCKQAAAHIGLPPPHLSEYIKKRKIVNGLCYSYVDFPDKTVYTSIRARKQ